MATGAIVRKMLVVSATLWSALIATAQSSEASPANCRLVGWYVSKAVFSSDQGKVEYSVRVSDPNWELDSFGWHANAMFGCAACEPGSIRNGLLWFSEATGTAAPPTPEDDQAFMSMIASSWFGHSDDRNPKPVGDQLAFDWSGFTAYARRYRAHSSNGDDADLFAITTSDGCVQTRIYASMPHEEGLDHEKHIFRFTRAIELSARRLEE